MSVPDETQSTIPFTPARNIDRKAKLQRVRWIAVLLAALVLFTSLFNVVLEA